MLRKQKIAILISGNGSNMKAIVKNTLTGILKEVCEVSVVISNKKEISGFLLARELGVKAECIESKGISRKAFEEKLLSCLKENLVDYIVLAGFMRILTPKVLNHYRMRVINIHPADTHLHQGIDGYLWAYQRGLDETKITIHYVDEGVDTGKIIAQRPLLLQGLKSLEEVIEKGLEVEHEFYSEVLLEVFLKAGRNLCVASLE